jgi:hypothetical protein
MRFEDGEFSLLHESIHLTMQDSSEALRIVGERSSDYVLIRLIEAKGNSVDAQSRTLCTCSLSDIFSFDMLMRSIKKQDPSKFILLCTGTQTHVQIKTAFLVGCHLMISSQKDYQEVLEVLPEILRHHFRSKDAGYSTQSCMLAVKQAIANHWIDFRDSPELRASADAIDVEEYLHYAR